jgi:OmpA-OmpF porin, OOP family
MRVRTVLLGTVAVMCLAGSASAAERHGWYFGIEAGWVKVNDSELPNWGYTDIEFDNRWGMMGTVGYAFQGNWRLEFEGGYRNNDIDRIDTVPINDGELTEWSGLFNAVYNQPISEKWTIDFGAGAGMENVRFDDNVGSEDADTVLALQGLLGLTYRVGPHWDVMLNYRYLWANNPEFTDIIGNVDEMAIAKHTVTLGFRFGYEDTAPPPPPPAPPPPPPAPAPEVRQFIIFFGFDRCDITAEADQVLSNAAMAAKSDGITAVKIVGHTDTSGSVSYNQRLSECRSGAAKANMVGKGVPAGSISATGRGEGELMVQTGDGVKEPQNRRATVDLE